jgi:hypothetical protein
MFDSGSSATTAHQESNPRPWAGIVTRVLQMQYGESIPTAALYTAAGLSEVPVRGPGERDKDYVRRCEKNRLLFASLLLSARKELLKNCKRDLQSTKPGEYELVTPREQADRAQKDALREARKALSSGANRAAHVATQMLNDEERRRASDVEAHLDSLRAPLRALGKTRR